MSVITQRGDRGETDLLFGRRVSKTHPRVLANGAVDELNAAIGLARWHTHHDGTTRLAERLALCQNELIRLMGQIATLPEDGERYEESGFERVNPAAVESLTLTARRVEASLNERFRSWAVPGAMGPLGAAHLDQARTVCRRAEQQIRAIPDPGGALENPAIYLNRLADFLWLAARAHEKGWDFRELDEGAD